MYYIIRQANLTIYIYIYLQYGFRTNVLFQNPRYNSGSGRTSSRNWRTETSSSFTWK